MFVAVLQVDLGIPGAFSLKDRRSVVKRILERLRHRHGVAAAEVGDHDTWNRARIGVAFVGNERRHVESHMTKVLGTLEADRDAVVLDSRMEII